MNRAAAAFVMLGGAASLMAGDAHLIAVDSDRSLYELDAATGLPTRIGTVTDDAGVAASLTVGRRNRILLSSTSNDALYTLDPATGSVTLHGPYGPAGILMHGIEYVPAIDTLYGFSSQTGGLYVIDQATGAATLVGGSGLQGFGNIAWNAATGVMYLVTATEIGSVRLYRLDLATGSPTLVGPVTGPSYASALAFDPDNGLYMLDNIGHSLYRLDMESGAATAVGATGPHNLIGLTSFNGPIPVELTGFTLE